MPLSLGSRTARLEGHVGIDDTEALVAWLRRTRTPTVNLKGCTHLHTAVLQALVAARIKVSAAPADDFLAAWILPMLEQAPAPDTVQEFA